MKKSILIMIMGLCGSVVFAQDSDVESVSKQKVQNVDQPNKEVKKTLPESEQTISAKQLKVVGKKGIKSKQLMLGTSATMKKAIVASEEQKTAKSKAEVK